MPHQNAEIVSKALMDSTVTIFDQGIKVDGRVIRQLCNPLKVSKTRTSAYHPAYSGQVVSLLEEDLKQMGYTTATVSRCYHSNRKMTN